MNIIISLFICLIINEVVSFLVHLLVPDYFLATILTSIILSFVFAILSIQENKSQFYKQKNFYIYFFSLAIIFMILDAIFFIL